MFFSDTEFQLQIYFFFLLADGECCEDEMKKFLDICNSMDVCEEDIKEIVDLCNESISVFDGDNSTAVIGEISKIFDEEGYNYYLELNKCEQVKIVWTLINLGYANGKYSEPEKKVVTFLVDYWEVNKATLADLNDTADTILMLTQQKDWIKTTNKPYDVVTANIENMDKAIERMAKNIEMLILEANIA